MKKFFKVFGLVVLIAAFIGTFVYLWKKSQKKSIEYEVVQPETRTIQKKIVINGSLEPRDEVLIKPQISGIITEIYKEAGQTIKAGEVIAKVKVIPDLSQLSSAESSLKVANISLDQSKKEYDRAENLYKSGVISKETYESTYSSYLKAKEEVENAKENIAIIKEGISKNTAQYSNTQIKSTISGMILDIPVKVGNSVIQANTFNDGTTIASIANMNDLIFNGKIDETDVGKVAIGNKINLLIGALQNSNCNATLEYIAPKGVVENGATTFQIKAAVTHIDSIFIRSGYSANGEIIIDSKDSVLSIPESTLTFENDSTFVYVKKDNIKNENVQYVKTPVKTGISDGIYIEIVSGITKKDKIRGGIITAKNDKKNNKDEE